MKSIKNHCQSSTVYYVCNNDPFVLWIRAASDTNNIIKCWFRRIRLPFSLACAFCLFWFWIFIGCEFISPTITATCIWVHRFVSFISQSDDTFSSPVYFSRFKQSVSIDKTNFIVFNKVFWYKIYIILTFCSHYRTNDFCMVQMSYEKIV